MHLRRIQVLGTCSTLRHATQSLSSLSYLGIRYAVGGAVYGFGHVSADAGRADRQAGSQAGSQAGRSSSSSGRSDGIEPPALRPAPCLWGPGARAGLFKYHRANNRDKTKSDRTLPSPFSKSLDRAGPSYRSDQRHRILLNRAGGRAWQRGRHTAATCLHNSRLQNLGRGAGRGVNTRAS